MIVTNNTMQVVALQDGTILAAAGREGSSKSVESLDARDQRLVRRGFITVMEEVSAEPAIQRRPLPVKPKPEIAEADSQVKES